MMFGVHGGEEIRGGFVLWLGLASAPVHEETVAEPAQHTHHPHGLGEAHAALVIQMTDASQMAVVAEPFFHWLKADIEFIPVMKPEDLMKAGPAIESAVGKWG